MIGRRYIHKSLGKEKSVAKGKNWPNFVKIKFNIIVVMLNYDIHPVFFGFSFLRNFIARCATCYNELRNGIALRYSFNRSQAG